MSFFGHKLIGVAALFLVWEVASRSGLVPDPYLPPVTQVLGALWQMLQSGELLQAEALTILRTCGGFAAAILAGGCLAATFIASRYTATLLQPLVEFLRPLPPAALIPLAIFYLGIGPAMFGTLICFTAMWPIFLSTLNALRSVDKTVTNMATSFGFSRASILLEIRVPAAAPEMFTGLRVAGSVALITATVTEMLAGRGGIGFLLFDTAFGLRFADMYAVMIVAGINGLALNALILLVRRSAIGWHLAQRQRALSLRAR
jgi:ABC-type nitrate/sulfonate/bicarbonate transport system permease component